MNQVGQQVIEVLSQRQRVNKSTDLEQLTKMLARNNPSILLEDVIQVFRQFSNDGAGSIVRRRGKNPTRFIWNYNLKEYAEKALGKRQDVSELSELGRALRPHELKPKRRVGRPKTNKSEVPKVKFQIPKETIIETKEASKPIVTINFELPKGTTAKDLAAVLDLLKATKVKE